MKKKEAIYAGLTGTSVMTAFSYGMSVTMKENYKEPKLLGLLMKRLSSQQQNKNIVLAGWPLHYALGCVWSGIYTLLLDQFRMRPSFKPALFFGLFSGTTGVLIWKEIFRLHPDPPSLPYKRFYVQLFAAHILFALAVSGTYALLDNRSTQRGK